MTCLDRHVDLANFYVILSSSRADPFDVAASKLTVELMIMTVTVTQLRIRSKGKQ